MFIFVVEYCGWPYDGVPGDSLGLPYDGEPGDPFLGLPYDGVGVLRFAVVVCGVPLRCDTGWSIALFEGRILRGMFSPSMRKR